MKICFIAPASNYHTQKWSRWFASRGHEIHIISFVYAESTETATVHFIDTGVSTQESDRKKLKYLLYAKKIKKLVEEIKPDIVNVHYATSYGTATALSGIKGYVLSVWGSDVYDFPQKSFLHKAMLKYSLKKAEYLFSTSYAMAEEASKYTNKRFEITPFGVDMQLFSPDKRTRNNNRDFVVGTVKSLTPKYGIEYLLKAVAIIKKEHPDISIKLRIAGKGTHEQEYKNLAEKLGIDDITVWLGFIPQEEAAKEWADMDVAVSVSVSESFGVAAVEAQACGVPIIISDIPGLMEATRPGETSVVVPREDEKALAEAIVDLYFNEEKRRKIGSAGRKFVSETYEWNVCFEKIEELFRKYIG